MPAAPLVYPMTELLAKLQNADGGWPYFAGGHSALEPTAVAVAALWALDAGAETRRRGLEFIVTLRVRDGGLRPQATQPDANALGALAAIVHTRCGGDRTAAESTLRSLAAWPIRTVEDSEGIFGNDTSLRGLAWTPDTYSWVEPTAWFILLHDALGGRGHARNAEARALLVDRAIPTGGWNYGNPRVFGAVLEPDPLTTAWALLAMLDDPSRPVVRAGRDYLHRAAERISSALTLAWATIALRAHGVQADPTRPLQMLPDPPSPWQLAAAALAAAPIDRNPFVMRGPA
jgi:hypothetical protein